MGKKKNKKIAAALKQQSKPADAGIAKPKKAFQQQSLLPGSWTIHAGIFLAFVLATLFLYSGDLRIGFFNLDDPKYVLENPWIRGISAKNIGHIIGHAYFANYSPVHIFSYMLDHTIGGDNAFVFHLSNNIWAGIVAGFVYLVGLALTQKRLVAIAAATLFVVHPVHVEAVAWISSRKDLIAAAFILPSFLAYLKYRTSTLNATKWYILSLFLFFLALGGKLSVAAFPAVLVAYDLFMEKRSMVRSLIDKIPFLVIIIIFTIAVMNAQPPTGSTFHAAIAAKSFFQGLWLLSGFGTHVIYRVAPASSDLLMNAVSIIALIGVFVFPLFIRKRYPLVTVLIYWILFTFLPSQVLSFVNPVADRYLFLPSVALCILTASLIFSIGKWTKRSGPVIPISIILIIAFLWVRNTYQYLNEWKDPRTAWYGASKKSSDMQVYYNLGLSLKDKAARIGSKHTNPPLEIDVATDFANVVWKEHPLLPRLVQELNTGQHNGAVEDSFQRFVNVQALDYLNKALENKGQLNVPDIYYYKGQLLFDMGNLSGAKNELLKGIEEAKRIRYEAWKKEMLVRLYSLLSDTEYNMGKYMEALQWVKLAEEEQTRYGANWYPNLTNVRKELERIIDTLRSLNQLQ